MCLGVVAVGRSVNPKRAIDLAFRAGHRLARANDAPDRRRCFDLIRGRGLKGTQPQTISTDQECNLALSLRLATQFCGPLDDVVEQARCVVTVGRFGSDHHITGQT